MRDILTDTDGDGQFNILLISFTQRVDTCCSLLLSTRCPSRQNLLRHERSFLANHTKRVWRGPHHHSRWLHHLIEISPLKVYIHFWLPNSDCLTRPPNPRRRLSVPVDDDANKRSDWGQVNFPSQPRSYYSIEHHRNPFFPDPHCNGGHQHRSPFPSRVFINRVQPQCLPWGRTIRASAKRRVRKRMVTQRLHRNDNGPRRRLLRRRHRTRLQNLSAPM